MVDVAILGGGPAGLAAAALLARSGRAVTVLEREARIPAKAGETFGPRVRPLLRSIGVDEEVVAAAAVPFRGVRSAWGTAEVDDRPSVMHPLGEGWHVDRVRFEEALAGAAERAGAVMHRGAGACSAAREGDGFRVESRGMGSLRARYLVDASGRGSAASARLEAGRTWLSFDRQIAVVLRMPLLPERALEPELLLESCEEGWWYAVPQPDRTLLLTLLTDADLAGPREQHLQHALKALERTVHVARLAGEAGPPGTEPITARADTGFLVPDRGPGWRALGDAALGGDPLAGDGVKRALQGALDAAPEIERELDGAPFEPARPPAERIESYLRSRTIYYTAEQRWPDSLYWRRRQPIDFRAAPLTLAPLERLQRGERKPDAPALARAEALLPRRALTAALELLRDPQPAHAVLAEMRRAAPLDDRRLLVGLQLLVEDGLVSAG